MSSRASRLPLFRYPPNCISAYLPTLGSGSKFADLKMIPSPLYSLALYSDAPRPSKILMAPIRFTPYQSLDQN
ncbi:hypothetical protein Moror_3336 [Moniliophthora roreri MCA 2997]|uniref:Uncharacterized protein n=1 Tax=Moniliophthora roreri (strain MCA 2997) TaxID=1381753 RepID=V2Y5Q0_MONRO|nr:hypothetical protein Moror_3336 [Moniliophthora roreri MCA 2997]